MDGANVFPNDAEAQQLHGSEKEEAQHQWGATQRKAVPENDLVEEIEEAEGQAESSRDEPGRGDQTEWHLREVGDAEHRQIVEGIEVVLGDAALAAVLIE